MFFFVFALILLAVLLPSMEEHPDRAKVSEGILSGADYKLAINEYYITYNRIPSSLEEMGIKPIPYSRNVVQSTTVSEGGVITVIFKEDVFDGASIIMTPSIVEGDIQWDCSEGTLERKYRPISCRK